MGKFCVKSIDSPYITDLFFYDLLIYLPSCDIVIPGQGNIQVSFVVAQIKVDFTPIVENIYLP